ncbi:hypothetical protein D6I20_04155 [Salmonella enterica]|uniref:Uncharacterized protein n=1 Tax=Salmonella enterica subsp. enterica serovar Cotham TaxID=2572724 RepID=A0A5Z7WF30_SALET|nr:hypothetical protein [Salmonella enterica]ECS7439450.1 hypothetical protein [Salmonella enterica subsp. enterica serovar Cotham]EAP1952232.1 hypothetical protein [Salmonella enterica]EBL9354389.1 hypothetical protein [Salmonella enterica]EBM5063152.1 hypothetical protein [Salmonella enterica]
MMAMLRKFSITTLPQALEIARYCTRINRTTKQDHKHPPQTSIAESLCDRFHGALKGWLAFYCTNVVLNVHIEALFWCDIVTVVQPFCTMVRMITPFGGNVKVGTDFALYFYGDTASRIEDLVTTTTDHDQSGRVQVCPLNTF